MDMIEFFNASPGYRVVGVLIVGLIIGSFLNVVIYRLPIMLRREWEAQCREFLEEAAPEPSGARFDLVWPASHCPNCERRIRPWENIPILSYFWQRGRCRGCATRISSRYPLVELATALLSAIVAWHFGFDWQLAAALILTWSLVVLAVIDLDHQILPDNITLPLIWLGLLLSLTGWFTSPSLSIIGAAAGYLSFWLVFQLFRLLTGKEGMGYGDFKLLAVFGAWLGWQAVPIVIVLSSLVGAVVGIGLILALGRDRNVPIPFGPYLAAAGWLALLWRDDMIDAYLRFAGFK